jgi:hypothetical protein
VADARWLSGFWIVHGLLKLLSDFLVKDNGFSVALHHPAPRIEVAGSEFNSFPKSAGNPV